MASLLDIILMQQWLLGGLLSVFGAVLACLGLTLQKLALYNLAGLTAPRGSERYEVPRWRKLCWSPLFWVGLCLYVAHTPVSIWALIYAPQTTVLPIGAIQVLLNFVFAYSVLNERFTRRDMTATMVCVLATAVMNLSMPSNIPGYMHDFPYLEALHFCEGLTSNSGFAAYLLAWTALLAICVLMLFSIKEAKPLALPILVGLLGSQFSFMAKIAATLVFRGQQEAVIWNSSMTYGVLAAVASLYTMFIYSTCEGLRYLALRYYLPVSFVSVYAFTVIEGLLFFREWEHMSGVDICVFTIGCLVSVAGVYYISPAQRLIPPPGQSPLNSPLLPSSSVLAKHKVVLEIMDEYRFRKPQPAHPRDLEVVNMRTEFAGRWRLLPVSVTFVVIALPVLLWELEYVFSAFMVLTAYAVYNGWKMALHIAVFAYVGCKKVAHYENADFAALHREEIQAAASSPAGPAWEEVVHFVVLPNYKEDMEVLRLAIQSIARSGLAQSQIFLVLAMEQREAGAREKAEALLGEFGGAFREVLATYHPPDLPGETPGKAANTRWAAVQLFEELMPARGISPQSAVLTIADADSDFHREYFAALTYHFVHAGGPDGETPARYLSIWQPPIMHYKNYFRQPVIVRMASYITSQHELANLADPNATRVPYSTYSISAELAKKVQGWDPDWISEDWHMALKCFLATAGRLRISPIFLPVLNYSPEGETVTETIGARWTQAKRHALGFSELVYWHEHFPRILRSVDGAWPKAVFLWRGFFLWFKLLMIHVMMATFWIVGPFNAVLIAWFIQHEQPQDLNINSWTFLVNCVCQSISFLSFNSVFFMSVLLFETVKERVDGADDPGLSLRWRSPCLHSLSCMAESTLFLPLFFAAAAASEWIAAVKTARTHHFHYEVALKPNLSKVTVHGSQGALAAA